MIKLSVTREPATTYIQPYVHIVLRLPRTVAKKNADAVDSVEEMPGHTADHLCEKHAVMI